MNRENQRRILTDLLNSITPEMPEANVVTVLQEIIKTVGSMRYRLRDMPLISGALNLLISSCVLDHEEKEAGSYADSMAMKTIMDLMLE